MSEARLREIAARLGGRAELLDVRLMSGEVHTVALVTTDTPLSVTLGVDPSAELDDAGDALVVTVGFEISIAREPEPSGEEGHDGAKVDQRGAVGTVDPAQSPPVVATLACTYAALYDLGEHRAYEEDEIDAFARTTGIFALWPYARAWAQDTTARMGLPPLTLPVYRLPLEDGDDDG